MKPFLHMLNPQQTKIITQLKAKIRKLESEIEVLKAETKFQKEERFREEFPQEISQ